MNSQFLGRHREDFNLELIEKENKNKNMKKKIIALISGAVILIIAAGSI